MELEYYLDPTKHYLKWYLAAKGIDTTQLFNCINPKHRHKPNKTMKYYHCGDQVRCLLCGAVYDSISCIMLLDKLDNAMARRKAEFLYGAIRTVDTNPQPIKKDDNPIRAINLLTDFSRYERIKKLSEKYKDILPLCTQAEIEQAIKRSEWYEIYT